jgi:hypothetical protein
MRHPLLALLRDGRFDQGVAAARQILAIQIGKFGLSGLDDPRRLERLDGMLVLDEERTRQGTGEQHKAALISPRRLTRGIAIAVYRLALVTTSHYIGQPRPRGVGRPETSQLVCAGLCILRNRGSEPEHRSYDDQQKPFHALLHARVQ